MKNNCFALLYFAFALLHSTIAVAQQYTPTPKGSKVEFTVTAHKDGNQVVKGRFTNLKGSITFDPKHMDKSAFDITINADGVNTGLSERDKELKSASLFNTSLYPAIHIKSTSVAADGTSGIIYMLRGTLTIKDVTKPVNIQFTALPSGSGYTFRGSFHLNRLDYHVGDKTIADNDVAVYIELKAVKK